MAATSTEHRIWWGAFVGLSVALIAPIWLVTYPPGVDLPQHGTQIAIALGWFDESLPYREYYEYNALSQSILGHALVIVFALFTSIATALKLTISLALLAVPVASLRLIQVTGGDRWWVFATFPVASSFAFYWGFLNYLIAVPLGLLLVSVAVGHVDRPSRRSLVALATLPLLVFAGHVLVLAFAGTASAAVLFFGLRGGARWRALVALVAVVPLVAAWFVGVQLATPNTTAIPTIWGYGLDRLVDLPNHLVGIPGDLTYAALGLLVVAGPFVAGARPVRIGWRWSPMLVAIGLYLAVPHDVLGTAFLYPRYAVFVVPVMLVALRPGPVRQLGRALIVAVALCAAFATIFRFAAFERESRPFHAVVAEVEPGARVLGLTYGAASEAIPYPAYLHWVCWLQVERQALADFSFAEFFPNRFRYRADRDPDLPDHVEWVPQAFRWSKHSGKEYDYFLIRNRALMSPRNFAGATSRLELVIESGPWSLVRQRR